MELTLLVLSCAVGPQSSTTPDTTELDPVGILERASLDLRGVRPSIAEIERVEADPEALDVLVDEFMHDPRFGARVRDLFSTIYLTRQDYWYVSATEYGQTDVPAFARAVGEEPLRVLSTIAEEDLPYTEIVLGDWSMADETIGLAWPTDYPADGTTGWQKVHYTDGRPAVGVLSTNGMWWRYMTNTSNANRGRANAVSRILMCDDYLGRPIEFDRDVNLLDQGAVNDALKTNAGCLACHSTLDPLASYLWGFFYFQYDSRDDTTYYHPEREEYWRSYTEVSPGYYGAAGYDMEDLGRQIAGDSRLPNCISTQVFELLLQRESELADTDTITGHREALIAGDMRLRPLFADVIASDAYRAAPGGEGGAERKLVSVDQLGTVLEDLTGFRFTFQGYDMLQTDTYGLRTLAGGVDGIYSTRPATEPTATMVLVQERVAEAAAAYAVEQERLDPAAHDLFDIGFTATPDSDPEAFAAQLQRLHLRLYGARIDADGPEVAANIELWRELYVAEGDVAAAWSDLFSVLLRDPAFLLY